MKVNEKMLLALVIISLTCLAGNNTQTKTVFTEEEKTAIVTFWAKFSTDLETYGAEVLFRLVLSFANLKAELMDLDLSPDSADLRSFGSKLLAAIGEATQHLDNLKYALAKITALHSPNLKIDPGNFLSLSHCITVVMAVYFPQDFTPEVQAAWDKLFLNIEEIINQHNKRLWFYR